MRSSVVVVWIEEGYRLLWAVAAPLAKKMANAPSSAEHRDFVSGAVAEMLAGNAVTLLPPGERPWVVSPLGVVRKPRTDKFGLTVNMKYVNRHVGNKALKGLRISPSWRKRETTRCPTT